MMLRGIRGATTIEEDQFEAILTATRDLIQAIQQANPTLQTDDIASVLLTATPDITSAFPALAARQLGWDQVPLMCAQEISVRGGLPRCIRVLIHWNTSLPHNDIHHVYLRQAAVLRPDLARS